MNKVQPLDINGVSHAVKNSRFAVRGVVVNTALQLKKELESGKKFDFQELAFCNQGDPLSFSQNPIKANRQILSALINPDQVDQLPPVCKERCQYYLKQLGQGNVGAYTESKGYSWVRQSVANYIQKRDGLKQAPSAEDILMTNGASEAIQFVLQALIQNCKDGIMIPIPQYPLYSSSITLFQGAEVHYYLDEEKYWQVDEEELTRSYDHGCLVNIDPRAICIVNPGNPTGSVLNRAEMENFVKFAYDRNLIILADEVYQTCIYSETKKFVSFHKVITEMPSPYNKAQVFSFHSASKGQLGECGIRGGYVHFTNIDELVKEEIIKLRSISLCANTVGQVLCELMVNPIDCSDHRNQVLEVYNSMKLKAQIVYEILNSMEKSICKPIDGAMYGFVKLLLPQNFVNYAKTQNLKPDVLYCLMALNKTGVVLVPGSGFGQALGTYHFRTTILINPSEKLKEKMIAVKLFNSELHKQYADANPRI